MSIQRPIHVSTGVTRTSWYRLMRPVKEKSRHYGVDGPGALEVRGIQCTSVRFTCTYSGGSAIEIV